MLARGGAGLGMSIPGGTGASALVAGRLALCLSRARSWLVGGGRGCRSERGRSGAQAESEGRGHQGGRGGGLVGNALTIETTLFFFSWPVVEPRGLYETGQCRGHGNGRQV